MTVVHGDLTRPYAAARRKGAGEEMPPGGGAAGSRRPVARRLVTVEAVDVDEAGVEWNWRHRLLRGALNLSEGHPEAGKTAAGMDVLARLSAGRSLPDGEPCKPLTIAVMGAEDALESVVRPRLRAAGADLGRIRFITGVLSADCTLPGRVVLPNDLPLLAAELADRDLLYIDASVNDFARSGVRPGDDVATRELLGGLHELARSTGCTVWATRHGRKGGSRDPLEFGSGTMGGIAKARSVIGVFRDPRDPDRRLFARVKCNVAPTVPTLAFRLKSDGPDEPLRVEWLGEDPRSASDILEEVHHARGGTDKDPSRARRVLADWLRDGQWKSVAGLKRLTEAASLSWKAIEKAKAEMGVQHEARPGEGWCWRDPLAGSRGVYE